MKKTIILFFTICFVGFGFAEKVKTFPNLFKPTRIMVDKDRIFIVEFPHVFIYSLVDFKLIKKIGRKGEGPREFLPTLNLLPYPDHIIINSRGKISYFTKTGEFIKEIKSPFAGGVEPCEDVFVGIGNRQGNDKDPINYSTIDVYDKNFKKIREIDRKKADFQSSRFTFYQQSYYFYIMDNEKIIVTGNEGFVLNAFNKNGKKLFTIQEEYKKKKVTESDRLDVHNYFKTHPQIKGLYAAYKHLLKFADYFPAIQGFQPYDGKLYVHTYNKKGEDTEFYIYDGKGKLIKKTYLPIVKKDVQSLYPFYVDNGKLYRLLENEDEEEWELHITDVK